MTFSIIVPFYNGKEYIRDLLDSIAKLDFSNFELIIVNDCSDLENQLALIELVNCFGSIIDIKLLHNNENIGLMRTLNKGLIRSIGKYVIVLGQDDYICNNHLTVMFEKMELSSGASGVFCNAYYVYDRKVSSKLVRADKLDRFTSKEVTFFDLMKWNYVVSTGMCIKRESLVSIGGFDTTYRNHGEWLTWLKLVSIEPFLYTDKTVSYYRKHECNITNSMFNSEFLQTFRYYSFVNLSSLKMKPSLRTFAIFIGVTIKNVTQLFYKLIKSAL